MQDALETMMWSLVELVVIDAVDDGQVGTVAGREIEDALGAGLQMGGAFSFAVKMPVHSSATSTSSSLCGRSAGF